MLVVLAALAAGCGEGPSGPTAKPGALRFDFDFGAGIAGWSGGFSDYGPHTVPVDVVCDWRALPAPFTGSGYHLGGTNRSDDLFIYVKTQLHGFAPSTAYRFAFQARFVTDAPTGCPGVGGSPGNSVWIVAGASPLEPRTVLVSGEYRVNIARGNQSTGGPEGAVLGDIATANTDCLVRVPASKLLAPAPGIVVRSDGRGDLWLLLGMDSGFEAASQVSFQSLVVTAEPI